MFDIDVHIFDVCFYVLSIAVCMFVSVLHVSYLCARALHTFVYVSCRFAAIREEHGTRILTLKSIPSN